MNHLTSTIEPPGGQRPFRLSLPGLLLAAVAIVQPVPLLADVMIIAAESTTTTGATPENISSMSGGVGDDARTEMRKSAAAYNVHLVFSDRQGGYLAGIPFTVADRNGQQIHSGLSTGPWLYLKLPPGSYRIAAKIDAAWQSKAIQVGATGRSTTLSFVSAGG